MTVENCIKLLEAYKNQAENPLNVDGNPLRGDERKHAIQQSKANYENMKKHILSSKKFIGHPIRVKWEEDIAAEKAKKDAETIKKAEELAKAPEEKPEEAEEEPVVEEAPVEKKVNSKNKSKKGK